MFRLAFARTNPEFAMRNIMTPLTQSLQRFARDERGATAIEYALIAGCISIAIVATATSIGTTLNNTFTSVKNGFPS
jgi:pilus assembly protein Flp/PilA